MDAGRRRAAAPAARGQRHPPGARGRRRWWYEDPSRDIGVVGITGTDGKTTTSFLAVAALGACGLRTGPSGPWRRVGGLRDAARRTSRHPAPRASRRRWRRCARGDGGRWSRRRPTRWSSAACWASPTTRRSSRISPTSTLELHGTFERYRAAKVRPVQALAADGPNPAQDRGRSAVAEGRRGERGRRRRPVVRGRRPGRRGARPPYGIGRGRRRAGHRDRRGRAGCGSRTRRRPAPPRWTCAWPAASTSTTRSPWSPSARRSASTRPRSARSRVDRGRARPDGADRPRPAVHRPRGLRALTGLAGWCWT